MMRSFLVVVVLYEAEMEQSVTLQRLREIFTDEKDQPQILLYDNSRHPKFNSQWSRLVQHYHHDSSNSGVAGAYNFALSFALSQNIDWLILMDQDTNINDHYFKQLQIALDQHPTQNLFAPVVRSHGSIVSPAAYSFERASSLQEVPRGLISNKNFTVINSGLVVNAKEMEALGGYDKDLPLDFADHHFFRKYKKRNKHFVVMDVENGHSLSAHADVAFPIVLKRFKLYANAAKIYANKVGSIFPILWLWVRAIKLTLRFKKKHFITYLLYKK